MKNVKIFVSHRIDFNSKIIKHTDIYENVYCGAALATKKLNHKIKRDDIGDNISRKRVLYCEFSVMYWAWKNTNYDYYGLCHYRRYLSFAKERFDYDIRDMYHEDYLEKKTIKKHNLGNKKIIDEHLNNYDVIVGNSFDAAKLCTTDGFKKKVGEHYLAAKDFYFDSTHKIVTDLINKYTPKYNDAFRAYFNSEKIYAYNCFVMKKQYFNELCEFIFPIMFEFEKTLCPATFNEITSRSCGLLGEILFGIYITYLKMNNIKVCNKPIVMFNNTSNNIKTLVHKKIIRFKNFFKKVIKYMRIEK